MLAAWANLCTHKCTTLVLLAYPRHKNRVRRRHHSVSLRHVTSKLIVFVNWSNENTMPGRKEDFEKHRKRAARTLCQSSETMFQKVRKEGEAEHPRGGSRDEIADAHPSRNWVLTATNVSVIYLGVGNIAITVASQLPYVIGCFADDYRLWIFLPPLPLWCWGFPETTLGTTILELLKRFKIWGKRPPPCYQKAGYGTDLHVCLDFVYITTGLAKKTVFCLYCCCICLHLQIKYHVNWNYVLCIVKPKPNLYVNRLFKKITMESKHPNIIMSQWQNTTAMHACAYIQVTAAYNNQTVK